MIDHKDEILNTDRPPLERLIMLMAYLRSEKGCAWDRKQTHQSLVPYLVEETYEVIDAIGSENHSDLKNELGDLLCQIVFHAQVASEAERFDIEDVALAIVTKLIERHPHVFGESKDLDPKQVRDQWEKIKASARKSGSALDGVPRSMPALTMALRIGEKAASLGFDWPDPEEVMSKMREEFLEIESELSSGNKSKLTDEIGDMLFATVSLARKLEIDPEEALKKGLDKFSGRFQKLEVAVKKSGRGFGDHSLKELEDIWQANKSKDSS